MFRLARFKACEKSDDVLKPAVRFWLAYGEGFVRIRLAAGQALEIVQGGRDSEGGWLQEETIEFPGDMLLSSMSSDATDCDGRFQTDDSYVCCLSDIGGLDGPKWLRASSSQRDFSAEAMGY